MQFSGLEQSVAGGNVYVIHGNLDLPQTCEAHLFTQSYPDNHT